MAILATAVMLFLGCDNSFVQARTVSCSCTKKSDSHKLVTKSVVCKNGISKSKCCTDASKASPSVKNCKYAANSPELGSHQKGGVGPHGPTYYDYTRMY